MQKLQFPFSSKEKEFFQSSEIKLTTFEFKFPKANSYVCFLADFEDLKSNEAYQINFREKYIPAKEIGFKTKLVRFANKLIQLINSNYELVHAEIANPDYISAKEICEFLICFITDSGLVADYYLEFYDYELCAVIVRK